ncbi:MAG: glycosyltransferase family 4 protein [Prosthecobacter sp.]|uniref:glycosyltransferase family 4 protein n=1 Tax=Prosthecobacter sp. TaxID=1965333 RepID=UPI00390107FB
MHTAHILRKYDPLAWGGTETAVLRLLSGLKDHGVNGSIHCPDTVLAPADDPLRCAARAWRPYRPILPVSRISPQQRDQLFAWGGNLFSFDLLWHLLRDEPIHVIHSHALNRLAGIGLLAARIRRVPFVVTLHGGSLDLPASAHAQLTAPLKGGFEWGKALGWLVQSRHVLEKADAIITCNPREAELLRVRYPQQRVIVEPHCVPAERYATDCRAAALRAYPQLQGRAVLLKLARLDPVKNQRWLITELPRLVRDNPHTMLVLAGSSTNPECEAQIVNEITRLGLQQHVLLTGAITPGSDELIGLLQLADAMLLSSVAEPFGIVILEAWAAGTPVVSSRTSGPASLLRHGDNGCLYDLAAPDSFHTALQLARDQRAAITATARTEVLDQFSLAAAARRMKSLYRDLIHFKTTSA